MKPGFHPFHKTAFLNTDSGVQQENHAPVVKIIKPANNKVYPWNTLIPYSIRVSDQEDGESGYQEIASKEVLLKVKYLPDAGKVKTYLKQKGNGDSLSLQEMMVSNCFNCHAVKNHLIGPSFQEINKHYSHTRSNFDSLERRIAEGSSGIWGKEVMPTHPELEKKIIQNMVSWIMNNANDNDPRLDYYAGLEGAFQLKEQSPKMSSGIFVLTASYTDHGSKDPVIKKLKGQDMVIIHVK
jgi:cytochrome c